MQQMHQSYKCMKSQLKQSGCASNLLAHEDLGHLRKPIIGIYKPSSIMKNSHQYMEVTKQETLYYEYHGASLEHKCGKRIVALSLLSFLSFLYFGGHLRPLLFFIKSRDSSRLVGESQLPSSFPHMGQCSIMMVITLLFTYNSRITTR